MAKVSAENRADDMLVNAINGAETDCVLSMLCSPLQEEFCGKEQSTSQYENSFSVWGKQLRRGKRPALERKSHPILYPENFQKRDGKAKGRERQECRGRHLKDIQIQKEKVRKSTKIVISSLFFVDIY